VSSLSTRALILCERTGRWAASLRRHGLTERLRLIEVRSIAELEERLSSGPAALVGLELEDRNADRVLEWLGRAGADGCAGGIIVFADRSLRPYELVCREAGAVHFVTSELELLTLAAIVERFLSRAPVADLLEVEPPITEQVRARMPWGNKATRAG
jgi:hypothetical protein